MNNVFNASQTSIFFYINFSNIQLRRIYFESIHSQQKLYLENIIMKLTENLFPPDTDTLLNKQKHTHICCLPWKISLLSLPENTMKAKYRGHEQLHWVKKEAFWSSTLLFIAASSQCAKKQKKATTVKFPLYPWSSQ